MTGSQLPRFCQEAQSQLPALAADELTGWPARVVRAHVDRCPDCAAELARQQSVGRALSALRATQVDAPTGLLDELLAKVGRPDLRTRAAVPARGAVSGARPALSVAFLTVGALASSGLGLAVWKAARALRRSG